MSASGNNIFVTVAVGGRDVPMHLDTGANPTRLSALYAAAASGGGRRAGAPPDRHGERRRRGA